MLMTFGNIVLYHCCLHNHQIKVCKDRQLGTLMILVYDGLSATERSPAQALPVLHRLAPCLLSDRAWMSGALFLFCPSSRSLFPYSTCVRYSSQTAFSYTHTRHSERSLADPHETGIKRPSLRCQVSSEFHLNCNVSI